MSRVINFFRVSLILLNTIIALRHPRQRGEAAPEMEARQRLAFGFTRAVPLPSNEQKREGRNLLTQAHSHSPFIGSAFRPALFHVLPACFPALFYRPFIRGLAVFHSWFRNIAQLQKRASEVNVVASSFRRGVAIYLLEEKNSTRQSHAEPVATLSAAGTAPRHGVRPRTAIAP